MYSLNKYAIVYDNGNLVTIVFNNKSFDVSYEEYFVLKSENSLETLIDKLGENKVRLYESNDIIINLDLFKDENRFSRTIIFNNQTKFVNEKNFNMKILILGAGGTGSNLCYLLANSGFNNITVLDYDTVELSNLNRQAVYTTKDVGAKKTKIIGREFPENIFTIDKKIESKMDIQKIIEDECPKIVLKCIDSPDDIHLWIYEICKSKKIPFITGGILNGEGYIQSFNKYTKKNQAKKIGIKKISGTSPSHPYLISKISIQMYEEAIRIIEGNEFVFYSDLTKVKLEKYPLQTYFYTKYKNMFVMLMSFAIFLLTNNLIISSVILIGLSGEYKLQYKYVFIFGFFIGFVNIIRNINLYMYLKLPEVLTSLLILITVPIIVCTFFLFSFEYLLYLIMKKGGFVND